jgi:hypothetical protein
MHKWRGNLVCMVGTCVPNRARAVGPALSNAGRRPGFPVLCLPIQWLVTTLLFREAQSHKTSREVGHAVVEGSGRT